MKKIDTYRKAHIVGVIITSILAVHNIYKRVERKRSRYPPGLFGVPYFGSLFTLLYYKEDSFYMDLIPSYGPIVMHNIGQINFISLNDINLVKTMFNHKYCLNRCWQTSDLFESFAKQDGGSAGGNGSCSGMRMGFGKHNQRSERIGADFAFGNELWSSRRKAMLNAINQIGTNGVIEPQLHHLLNVILYNVLEDNLDSWYPRLDLRNATFNVIFGALFGEEKQLARTNEQFVQLSYNLHRWIAEMGFAILANLFYVPNIFGIKTRFDKKIKTGFKKAYIATYDAMNDRYIKDALLNYDPSRDSLFDQLYKNVQNFHEITRTMFVSDIIVTFSASTDTTGTVLEAAILWLAKYPKLQEEIYQELLQYSRQNTFDRFRDKNKSKDPNCKQHKEKLEYISSNYSNCVKFRAFINESLRVTCVAPKAIPRRVSKPCILKFNINKKTGDCCDILFYSEKDGDSTSKEYSKEKREYTYKIEENFMIEQNLLYIMTYDKKIWGNDPLKFDINNWIDSKTGRFINRSESMPFSSGRRNCVGQTIAMKAIKIILSNLILNYIFEPKIKKDLDNIVFEFNFTRHVLPEKALRIKRRWKCDNNDHDNDQHSGTRVL